MSVQRVVVDDSDPSIVYSGSAWTTTNGTEGLGSLIYEGSQHTIKGNGSFAFTFNGTAIDLYGTGGQVNISGVFDPLWACYVDNQLLGGRVPTNDTSEYWPFCSGANFTGGTHDLRVQVTGQGKGAFFFDRLLYTPTGGVVNGTDDTMWIGDADPAFTFDDNWSTTNALTISNKPGATVSLNFTGQGLTWIGDVPGDFPSTTTTCDYVIDGGESVSITLDGLVAGSTTTIYDHVFFTTPELSSGTHSIKVTYNGDYDTPLTVGYVFVSNATFSAIIPSPSSSSSVIPSSTSSSHTNHTSHTGAIAGGTVAGVVLLCAVVIAIVLYQRRRHQDTQSQKPPSVSPFLSLQFTRGDRTPKNEPSSTALSTQDNQPPSSVQTSPVPVAAESNSRPTVIEEHHKSPRPADVEAPPPPYGLH